MSVNDASGGEEHRSSPKKAVPSTAANRNDGKKSFYHGVAGASAGMITTAVLHPLDLIKIRLQGDVLNPSCHPTFSLAVKLDHDCSA